LYLLVGNVVLLENPLIEGVVALSLCCEVQLYLEFYSMPTYLT